MTESTSAEHDATEDLAVIGKSREYYFAILDEGSVYHIARDGETVCGICLHEKDQWYKRGNDKLIPPILDLCHFCDQSFHRGLALSKAQLRDEIAALAGVDRCQSGAFSKQELANLRAGLRKQLDP